MKIYLCSLLLLASLATSQAQEKIVRAYPTVGSLLANDPNVVDSLVAAEGLFATGDNGGGMLRYYPESTTATNAVTVFKPFAFGGRWQMVFGGPGTNSPGGGGGGSVPVGTMVAQAGTPTVGELAGSLDGTRTNALFLKLKLTDAINALSLIPTGTNTDVSLLVIPKGIGDGNAKSYLQVGPTYSPDVEITIAAPALVIHSATGNAADVLQRTAGDSYGGHLFAVSGGTLAAPTVSTGGNGLGPIIWAGYDGSDFLYAASIEPYLEQQPTASHMYGAIKFRVNNGAGMTDAATIHDDKRLELDGTLSLQAQTNLIGDNGSALTFNGVPIGGATINPTDQYIPYRSNSTTFANSPWFVITTNALGFNGTNFFLYGGSTISDLGIGRSALAQQPSGLFATAIGAFALSSLTSGSGNTAIGANAMQLFNGGVDNIGIGSGTLFSASGNNNIAIGKNAGLAHGVGNQNTIVGVAAGQSGNYTNSVFIGHQAGANSTSTEESVFIGKDAGLNNTSGYLNTYIGYAADSPTTTVTNTIVIGANGIGNGSNTATIGNTNSTRLYIPPIIMLGTNQLSFSGSSLTWNGTAITVP